jgi:molybdopterin biosynthesis enzyme
MVKSQTAKGFAMISVDEARRLIDAHVSLMATKTINISTLTTSLVAGAHDHILAESVVADRPLPWTGSRWMA